MSATASEAHPAATGGPRSGARMPVVAMAASLAAVGAASAWLLSGSVLSALLGAACGAAAPWIAREPRVGLIAILFALPLDRYGRLTVQPVILTAYHALLVLTLASWIWGMVRRRERVRWSAVDVGMAVLLFAALWSLPLSMDRSATAVAVVRIAFSVALVALFSNLVTDERWARRILVAFAVTAVVSALIAFAQYWVPGFPIDMPNTVVTADGTVLARARGLFKDANYLGALMAVALVGFAAAASHARSWARAGLWLAGAGVCGVALYLTMSRGSWIGAVAGLAGAALTAPPRRRAVIVAASAGLLVVAVLLAPAALRDRMVSSFDLERDESAATRFYMYASTAEMAKDHPVFGVGLAAFDAAYPPYRLPGTMESIVEPHEVPVALVAETGLAGVLAQIALVAGVVMELRRRRGTARTLYGSVAVAGLAFFAAGVFFEYFLYVEYLWMLLALAVVAGRIMPAGTVALADGGVAP